MKFLSVSVAIVCCIQFANAASKPTASQIACRSSVIFFMGTPEIAEVYLAEDQDLQNLLNTLTDLGGPLAASSKFSTIIASLATSIKNAVDPINTIKKDYIFLTKNIDAYATSQGTYNFPSSYMGNLVINLQKIVSILQDIQNDLTALNNGRSSTESTRPFLLDTPSILAYNPIEIQLKLLGTTEIEIQAFIAFLTSAPTSGENTVVDLNELKIRSLALMGVLPNFNELIASIITAVASPARSL